MSFRLLPIALSLLALIASSSCPAFGQPTGDWDARFRLNPTANGLEGRADITPIEIREYGTGTFHAIATDGNEVFLSGSYLQLHGLDAPDLPGSPVNSTTVFNSIAWFDGAVWRQMNYGVRGGRDARFNYINRRPGVVKAVLVDGDDVYVAGRFYVDADVNGTQETVNSIARWDRIENKWYGLGYGLATERTSAGGSYDGAVEDLFIWNGELYAAGSFSGSCTASECDVESTSNYDFTHERLARWDGSQWQTANADITRFLSRGSDVSFYQLAEDAAGDLIAAGNVEQVRDATGADIFCDGLFRIGATGGIGCVTGTARGGVDGTAYALTTEAATGDLIVGGVFTTVDDDSEDTTPGVPAQNVARWDGSTWSEVGTGLNGTVRLLRDEGTIQVYGDFATHAARFDGTAWQTLGSGTPEPVQTVATGPNGPIAVSDLLQEWDGSSWNYWGLGLNGRVNDIAIDPTTGAVYVAGDFHGPPGARQSPGIVRWDGFAWQPVGRGVKLQFAGAYPAEGISAIAVRDGVLYVGDDGLFGGLTMVQADGSELDANAVAQWDGTQWQSLGDGITTSSGFENSFDCLDGDTEIRTLAVTNFGDLYVGGCFEGAQRATGGRVASKNFIRWDGAQWRPTGGFAGGVNELTPRGGGVYVAGRGDAGGLARSGVPRNAGYFDTPLDEEAGDVRGIIAPAWVGFNGGVDGRVDDIAFTSTTVYLTGRFQDAIEFESSRLPDGSLQRNVFPKDLPGTAAFSFFNWLDPLSTAQRSANDNLGVLASVGNTLYASAGEEVQAPNDFVYVSRLENGTAVRLDGGVSKGGPDATAGIQTVLDMETDGPRLYVGGGLLTAGGASSGAFAIWGGGEALTDSDNDGIADVDETANGGSPGTIDTDGDGLSDAEEAGDDLPLTPPVDTDGDGIPDFADADDDGDDIPTATEIADATTYGGDPDTDGRSNWVDPDADGDTVLDRDEGTDDADGNGIPDYLDGEYAQLRLAVTASSLLVTDPDLFRDLSLDLRSLNADASFEIVRTQPGPTDLPGEQELAADRSWTLSFLQDVTFSGDVCFNLAALRLPDGADLPQLRVYKRDDAQSPWEAQPTDLQPSATAPTDLCATGITGFSEFVVSGTPDVLPVEMGSFEAMVSADVVELQWTTLAETNNAGFRVERTVETASGQPGAWVEIGSVVGAGTTSAAQTYRFRDAALPFEARTLHYRLRQVDVDGTETLSDPIRLALGAPDALRFHPPYPNPATTQVTVRYELPASETVRLELFDTLGRQVRTLVAGERAAGRVETRIPTGDLASGLYFVRLVAGDRVRTQRFTVVR